MRVRKRENRGNSEVWKEDRQEGEVTRRRRRTDERRVSVDKCREVKSVGAEKQIRQMAG